MFYFTEPAVITVRILALFCIIATNEDIAFLSEFSSLMISVENLFKHFTRGNPNVALVNNISFIKLFSGPLGWSFRSLSIS